MSCAMGCMMLMIDIISTQLLCFSNYGFINQELSIVFLTLISFLLRFTLFMPAPMSEIFLASSASCSYHQKKEVTTYANWLCKKWHWPYVPMWSLYHPPGQKRSHANLHYAYIMVSTSQKMRAIKKKKSRITWSKIIHQDWYSQFTECS